MNDNLRNLLEVAGLGAQEIKKLDAKHNPDTSTKFGGDNIDWKAHGLEPLTTRQQLPAKDKDYYTKPAPADSLEVTTHKSTEEYLAQLLTSDSRMLELKDKCRRLSTISDTILITGETGTGKELIARSLHGSRTGKFYAVNCGGFPEHIVDSILFGHRRGSFTGADRDHTGVFISAQDGTVFLDEIAELPMLMQSKLLRVLQEHEVTPVGSNRTFKTNARIVCATNKHLRQQIEIHRTFREDLYWRISTFTLETIPLRDRMLDVDLFIRYHKLNPLDIDTTNHSYWKGNYRELQQLIRHHQVFGTPSASNISSTSETKQI